MTYGSSCITVPWTARTPAGAVSTYLRPMLMRRELAPER